MKLILINGNENDIGYPSSVVWTDSDYEPQPIESIDNHIFQRKKNTDFGSDIKDIRIDSNLVSSTVSKIFSNESLVCLFQKE